MPSLASRDPMPFGTGTDYTLKMLYFDCSGQWYYAGQDGLPSRHETRSGVVSAT